MLRYVTRWIMMRVLQKLLASNPGVDQFDVYDSADHSGRAFARVTRL